MVIDFTEKDHSYKIDGVKAVGVSQLLLNFGIGDVSHIPSHILEPARDFGIKGHLMSRYHLEQRLKESALDPKLSPYLVGLKKLFTDHKIEIIDIEKPIGYDTLLVCGTPDLICMFNGVHTIIDFKFGKKVQKSSYLQAGGYQYLFNCNVKEVEDRVCQSKIVQLLPNEYKIFDVNFDCEGEFGTLLLAWHIKRDYR